jgi:hypothetical protein
MRPLLALAFLAAPAAFAQDSTATGKDIEDRGVSVESSEKKLDIGVFFETEGHGFDNLDVRALDETSDQTILDSDDKNAFAFTGVGLDLAYKVDETTRLVMGTSYRGLWGNDQFGNTNKYGGFIYFTSMYVEWKPKKGYAPTLRVGRQRMDLGGMGGAREFILGDIVDQVRVDFPIPEIGTVTAIPIDVIGLSAENDDVNFVGYLGQQRGQVFNFRGDRMTRRHGAIVTIAPEKVPGLDVRAYGYFSHVGALGTGSDISYQGRLGNFADKDWVVNTGVRAAYTIADIVTPFASFDASVGIDRKELVTNDVDTNGFAWSAGVVARKAKAAPKDLGGWVEARYFDATGPAFDANGLQYSHGYVSMKARQVGGLLANRFMGWHPTAYLGAMGVYDTPHDLARKSATRSISVDGEIDLPIPLSIGAGYWFMQDKGTSFLDQGAVDTITPPYGTSRDEFRAQARTGRVLGHEIDLSATAHLGAHFDLFAQGAVLLPGSFYGVEVARVVGTALGSSDPQTMWDVAGGVRVSF